MTERSPRMATLMSFAGILAAVTIASMVSAGLIRSEQRRSFVPAEAANEMSGTILRSSAAKTAVTGTYQIGGGGSAVLQVFDGRLSLVSIMTAPGWSQRAVISHSPRSLSITLAGERSTLHFTAAVIGGVVATSVSEEPTSAADPAASSDPTASASAAGADRTAPLGTSNGELPSAGRPSDSSTSTAPPRGAPSSPPMPPMPDQHSDLPADPSPVVLGGAPPTTAPPTKSPPTTAPPTTAPPTTAPPTTAPPTTEPKPHPTKPPHPTHPTHPTHPPHPSTPSNSSNGSGPKNGKPPQAGNSKKDDATVTATTTG